MEKSSNAFITASAFLLAFSVAVSAYADNANRYEPAIQEKLNLIEVDHHSLDFFNSLVEDYGSATGKEEKAKASQALEAQMAEAVKRLNVRLESKLSYSADHAQSAAELAKRRAADTQSLEKMKAVHSAFSKGDGADAVALLNQFSHSWLLTQSNEIAEAWSMMLASQR